MRSAVAKSILEISIILLVSILVVGCASSPPAKVDNKIIEAKVAEHSIEELERMVTEEKGDVSNYLALMTALQKVGNYDGALGVADDALENHPSNPQLLFSKSMLLWALGWQDQAGDFARDAALSGGDSGIQQMALQIMVKLERKADARKVAENWVKLYPDSADAQFNFARQVTEEGDEAVALKAYHRTLELNPDHHQTLSVLGVYYKSKGDDEKALGYLKRLIELVPSAQFQRVLLAELYVDKARYPEALEVIREGLERSGDPEVLSGMGMLAAEMGDYELGVSYIEKLVAKDPQSKYWFLLGSIRDKMEDFEGAAEAYGRVEEGDFLDIAKAGYIVSISRAGKKEEAEGLLSAFLEKPPLSLDAVIEVSNFLSEEKRVADSIKLLEKYKTIYGAEENARLHFVLGVAHDANGDWEKSVEEMRRVLEISPEDPYAMNYIAYTYAVHEISLDEAKELALKATERMPGNGPFTDTLGWVLFKQGDFEGALENLEEAVKLLPKDPIVIEHLGDLLLKIGESERAGEMYQRALELDPENETLKTKAKESR